MASFRILPNIEPPPFLFSFVCQRCLQPLKINPSFYSMTEHTEAELKLPLSTAPDVNLEADPSGLDKIVPPFRLPNLADSNATLTGSGGRPNMATTNSHGFTLVGESGQQVLIRCISILSEKVFGPIL
jgi:hypothetical protein